MAHRFSTLIAGSWLFMACSVVAAQETAPPLFATVDDFQITAYDYDRNARETFRRKFYHGKPPEAEVNKMLREVGQALIDRVLLNADSRNKGVSADAAEMEKELAKFEEKQKRNPLWETQRAEVMAVQTKEIEQRLRLEQLEKQVRTATPSQEEIKRFYQSNLELFTEPARNKASLILLRVDPSSSSETWDETKKKAEEIRTRIVQGGEDFATLAKELSNDPTGPNGGDLGYLHEGMLSGQAEVALAGLKIGEISEPVRTLEGEALLRLDAHHPSKLQPFEAVEARARALLVDRLGNKQWAEHLEQLRAKAKITISPAFAKIMAPPDATEAPRAN